MKNAVLLIGLVLGCSFGHVLADDSASFDVGGGGFDTLAAGTLVPNTAVACDFSVEEVRFDTKWNPSISIIFKEAGEEPAFAKLSAFRSNLEAGWRYELTITSSEGRTSKVNAYTGQSESILPMRMILSGDKYVIYYIGHELDNVSVIDASLYSLAVWSVAASGVKGISSCKPSLPK